MKNKHYLLLGILAFVCAQNSFGMVKYSFETLELPGNQTNNNRSNGSLLPLAFTTSQKLETTVAETLKEVKRVELPYGCWGKVTITFVKSTSKLEFMNGESSCPPIVESMDRLDPELFYPQTITLNQLGEAIRQFSNYLLLLQAQN